MAFPIGIIGRDAASHDEIALSLTAGLAANSRLFSVGHDLKSTLDVYLIPTHLYL